MMERALFGTLAVELRYLTSEQLARALAIQQRDRLAERPHRPLGQICLEEGLLSVAELVSILEHQGKMIGGCC
jgi:hypothetical protein